MAVAVLTKRKKNQLQAWSGVTGVLGGGGVGTGVVVKTVRHQKKSRIQGRGQSGGCCELRGKWRAVLERGRGV